MSDNWISVDTELPEGKEILVDEMGQQCEVIVWAVSDLGGEHWEAATYYEKSQRFAFHHSHGFTVTHWIYAPEPPETK